MMITETKTLSDKFNLTRKELTITIGCGLIYSTLPPLILKTDLLHSEEIRHASNFKFDKRKHSYLLGRIAAKNALKQVTSQNVNSLFIDQGVFHFPVVKNCSTNNLQVSISHCESFGIALAFEESHPMAVDLEKIDKNQTNVIKKQLTENELRLLGRNRIDLDIGSTILWTLKEGISKVLRTGLMMDFKCFEIEKIEKEGTTWISHFTHNKQYKGVTCIVGDYVISIIMPLKSTLDMGSETELDFSFLFAPFFDGIS